MEEWTHPDRWWTGEKIMVCTHCGEIIEPDELHMCPDTRESDRNIVTGE